MSHREKNRRLVAPEARLGALRSVAPPSQTASGTRPLDKPSKNAQQCIRHDARSAYHSLAGFLELLGRGTLGAISEEQRLSLSHIRGSAHRLLELIESSVELGLPAEPLPDEELRLVSIEGLLLTIVNSALREQPRPHLELQSASGSRGLLVSVEPEELTHALRILISLVAGPGQRDLQLWLSQTDLHAVLVLSSLRDEGSVTQSMPVPYPAADSVDDVSEQLESRDYVRLKRCESVLARQHATLLVAGDLSRIRITLRRFVG